MKEKPNTSNYTTQRKCRSGQKTVIIHAGTNDTRKHIGMNEESNKNVMEDITKRFKKITDKLEENQVEYKIYKMPPIYCQGKQGEAWAQYVTILNTKLEERYPDTIIQADYTIGDRPQIREDGIHITDLSAAQ